MEEEKEIDVNNMPGLSGTSAFTPPEPANDDQFNRVKTKLHELCIKYWRVDGLDNDSYFYVTRWLKPDTAKETKNGFEVDLIEGGQIQWGIVPDAKGVNHEKIYKKQGKFTQTDAHALVAMAKLRGWNTIELHGNLDQKEKLWLAIQVRNMADQKEFESRQQKGVIPKIDKDGKPVKFIPTTIGGFKPAEDSLTMMQWKSTVAEMDAAQAKMQQNAATPDSGAAKEEAPPKGGATDGSKFAGDKKEPNSVPHKPMPSPFKKNTVKNNPLNPPFKPR